MFYETHLKKIVEEETKGLEHKNRLAKIVDVTKREWNKASDEVKVKVRERKAELEKEQLLNLESGPPTA